MARWGVALRVGDPPLGVALVARAPRAIASPADPAARRSLRGSCSRAEFGRSCAPKVSPATSSVRASMAMDADSRATPPGPGRRQSAARRRRPRQRRVRKNQSQTRRPNPAAPAAPTEAKVAGRLRSPRRRQPGAPEPKGNPCAGTQASRVARVSRTRSRRHRSRRADRDGLVQVAAGRVVAPADRTRLVVVRGRRGCPLHAGTAR